MKKLLIAGALALSVALSACAGPINVVSGNPPVEHKVPAYGLFNQEDKVPGQTYKISVGSVIVSAIFCTR